MLRAFAISLICACLLATPALGQTAEPPSTLAPYVHDGAFAPGDYGWMRGRFDDAPPAEKSRYAEIRSWLQHCQSEQQALVSAQLVAMGIEHPQLLPGPYQDKLCGEVSSLSFGTYRWSDWAAFHRDLEAATPVAEAFLWAISMAGAIVRPQEDDLAQKLRVLPLGEQMLRFGMGWGEGQGADAPALSPGVKAIVLARISMALYDKDRANTEYLKKLVRQQGWPRLSSVGKTAAYAAWLIAQHADEDPAFQIEAIRLMEPLLASGEVSRSDLAYLYDRTMLKMAGKQRYGTQMICQDGQRAPRTLEDAANLDRWRKEAGLQPMPDYLAQMDKVYGPCPW